MSLSIKPVVLGVFPTPVVELHRLSAALGGPQIFMKRDDLTGLALGGNKTRKLTFILADALEQGCDTIITAGAAQSNHCRQTAAAAAQLGMECHLVLGGDKPDTANGNLLLDNLLGAKIHWSGVNRKGEDIPHIATALKEKGRKPYVVPYGGSNVHGAASFVHATNELAQQLDLNALTHVVFASSSGGTHAGLMLGKVLAAAPYQLVGIDIDKGVPGEMPFAEVVLDLANRTSEALEANVKFTTDDLILNDNYVGEGYGVIGELEKEAIELVARYEGVFLDPVYTGRAMGGLIDMIRKGQLTSAHNVLFWHTGGAPALFAYADALQ